MLTPQNFAESGNEKISLRLNLIGWDPKGPVIAADLPPSFPRLGNKQNLFEYFVLKFWFFRTHSYANWFNKSSTFEN